VPALTTADLLDAWERGLGQAPAHRALTLLCLACPGQARDGLARLSVGRRDAHLIALRERALGGRMAGLVTCPGCGEEQELEFDVADVLVPPAADLDGDLETAVGEHRVRYRLPDSLDLAAMAGLAPRDRSWRVLLARCILAAARGDVAQSFEELPEHVLVGVVDAMAQADAQADLVLALDCAACGGRWEAAFDIARFLWGELEAAAHRGLHDVHTLASAYGWREGEILAMSPVRRQAYLELAGS
jgi:hypothetical protein